jgi:hypothetical protein
MNTDDIKIQVEEILNSQQQGKQLDPAVVADIMFLLSELKDKKEDPDKELEDSESLLKIKLLEETDWKKRAIIAAEIIKKRL